MKFQKNQIIDVLISETNMLGFGVVKLDGAVIFVQFGVGGDHCKIRIIKCAKSYYIARIEEMLSPSANRIEPECNHFRRCGGCSFQHITYDHEKELKKQSVEGFLKKEGLADVKVLPVLSTDRIDHYRNKAQFPVSYDENGKVICGFYAPKTHRVCPLEDCSIQHPLFIKIAKCVCDFLSAYNVQPYNEEDRAGLVRHIYLRIAASTGQVMLCLVLKEDAFDPAEKFVSEMITSFPQIQTIALNIQPENNNVILGKKTVFLYGTEKITDVFCDRKLMISPLSFYQVNHDAAEILYRTAFSMAGISKYDHVIDLYCGIGSISMSTHAACPITGVEIIPEAVKDANENASLNSIEDATFICGDASDAFRLIDEKGAKNPLLIVDPPRKGLTQTLIEEISSKGISNILYISCGPDTFARDLAFFREKGYEISDVQPVDLFPRTSHVENIAMLQRQTVHTMRLDASPFEMIRNGEKTIELRLFDEKRQQVKVGDRIVFINSTTGVKLSKTVARLHKFDSFKELYKSLPLLKCGYTGKTIDKAKPEDMERYYSVEQQNKFGVIGIELTV